MVFLNEYPNKPVPIIDYESLTADGESMCLSEIQGAYKTHQYIDGSYEAQYQFKIVYRSSTLNSIDKRLKATETLNRMADWLMQGRPSLGSGKTFRRMDMNSRASLFGRYEDGTEDYQVLMTLNYEVIKNG